MLGRCFAVRIAHLPHRDICLEGLALLVQVGLLLQRFKHLNVVLLLFFFDKLGGELTRHGRRRVARQSMQISRWRCF